MPRLSDTMAEGILSQWVKREGDRVRKGDVLAVIETDKAAMDMEARGEGVLARILVAGGSIGPDRDPDRRHRQGRRRSYRAAADARPRPGRTSGGSCPGIRTARRGIARRVAARVSAGPQARQ